MSNVMSKADLINHFMPQALRGAEFMRNLWWSYRNHGHPVWNQNPKQFDFASLSDQMVTGQSPLFRTPYYTTQNTWQETEAIRYTFSPYCYIEFFDIRAKEGANTHAVSSPAEIISKHTVNAGRTTLEHDASTAGVLKHTFTREEENESIKELAITASAEFRQLIKVGGEASSFASETEITTSLETVVKNTGRNLTKIGLSVEYEEPVEGRVKRVIEWLVEMGQYQQKVTIDGELDYGMRFWSHGDFTYTWLSGKEWIDSINGIADPNTPGRDNAARVFNHQLPKQYPGVMPDGLIDSIGATPLSARVELTRKFERAYDQSFKTHDEPLDG